MSKISKHTYKKKAIAGEDTRFKMKGGPHRKAQPRVVVCPDCKGMGDIVGSHVDDNVCKTCDGNGTIYK